jgi:hypothetical protein
LGSGCRPGYRLGKVLVFPAVTVREDDWRRCPMGMAMPLVGVSSCCPATVVLIVGGAMKIVVGSVLVTAAAAGLVFAMAGSASAVPVHQHCLLTESGFVPIGTGVSEEAPHDTAFHNLHFNVHLGEPGEQVTIIAVPVGTPCP